MAKYRSGFVSNSSSSSFICNVCGETASGMDMCISDSGMFQCENGHTCCEDHQIETDISMEDKRKILIDNVEASPYYKTLPKEKSEELETIKNYSEDDVDDNYNDLLAEDGHSECECPICMFERVDVKTAFKYLLKKNGLTEKSLLKELTAQFKSFTEFSKSTIEK